MVFYIFLVFYAYSSIPTDQFDPRLVDVIGGPSRMATKHNMDNLRNRLVLLLTKVWPKDLQGWEYREEDVQMLMTRKPWDIPINSILPDPVRVIRLATDVRLPSVLAAAFYDLHRIYNGRTITHQHSQRSGQYEMLHDQDLQRFVAGRERLRDRVKDIITLHHGPFSDLAKATRKRYDSWDSGSTSCLFPQWTDRINGLLRGDDLLGNPIATLSTLAREVNRYERGFPEHPCRSCTELLERRLWEERDKLWQDLRKMFEIPTDWSDDL